MIAELRPDAAGGFEPRGAVRDLWKGRDFEAMVSGPAETGKTYGCLQYADALLWKYPGAQGVMVRKTYSALVTSALRTYHRIIGKKSPIRPYGGERAQWFDYPNGSRLWLCGLDNPEKTLSTERDFFYVNQAEELSVTDWELLTTRATGRGAVMPYTRVFGDCNPGGPGHWIKQRAAAGRLRLLESRHEDNPTLFDAAGGITEQGRKSLAVLDGLTGVRRERLRFGRWVQAEGVVFSGWDAAVHLIDHFEPPADWPRVWAVDFGYTNPFVWQAWAMDPDGRLYRYREIYRTQRLVEDHAAQILQVTEGEPIPAFIVCDHDAEDRATLERHLGMATAPAHKAVSSGIEAVASRLKKAGDGKARLFLMRDALVERDSLLEERRLPCCTEEEIEGYVLDPKTGKPVKINDHGCDGMRYVVAAVDRIDVEPFADPPVVTYQDPVFIAGI